MAAALALVFAASSTMAGDAGVVRETVEALEAERVEAMIGADADALANLFAPTITYTHSTAMVQDRDDVIAMLASGNVDYRTIVSRDVHYDLYPHTVVITGAQTVELTVDGNPLTSNSRFTVVWARLGKHWKCVAYQSTRIPGEAEGEDE